MYASQFDGNAAFSGGGFMPSQATQSAEPFSSSATKTRDTQALLPLTVKQINEALTSNDDKSNFLIDGVDVNNVTLVGMVHNKAERVTDVAFVLDDGTGRIDCNKWVNEAIDTKEMEGILDGMYVRVHGHLKGFHGKRSLNAFAVRLVTDFNEISMHFIECIYVHLYNTTIRNSKNSIPTQSQMPSSTFTTPTRGPQAPQSNEFASGLKDNDKLVLGYLQQPSCAEMGQGVHIDEIARKLNLRRDEVMGSIRSLEDEGFVYSTIDDYHYKSTVNA